MELLHQPQDIIAQRYRIINTLGQGGSGTTYEAEDLQTSQRVALKALSLHRMNDWKMMELFEREAKVLAQLNHPAIPRYLEYFHVDTPSDRSFYIAQQLALGKSLATLVQEGWHATEEEVRRIGLGILGILVYLQSFTPDIIHRDIKPQNIIRREDGQVFLVDFGAVQATYYNTFMRGSTVVGTFGYMAPEQFIGQAVPATDLYGLGATLLFLLTHRSPADLPIDRLKIDFRSHVQISEEFAQWLEKMLEPDVEDRFPSAKEALVRLRSLTSLRGQPIITKASSSKASSFEAWKALVGVGLATVAAVTVVNSFKYTLPSFLGFASISMNAAAAKGDVDTVRHYLERGVNANVKNYDGETPLHLAAKSNSKDVAKLLIAQGADLNAKAKYDNTPLHLAAESNSKDVAELLIAQGADLNAKCDFPISYGCIGTCYNSGNGYTPLHLAAESNSKDVAELLIAKGADLNAKMRDDKTPLHLALENNSKDVAALLIAKGADLNAKMRDDKTPLHLAAESNSKDVAALLIAKGADLNAKAKSTYFLVNRPFKHKSIYTVGGYTPLHVAAGNNSKEVAELLIAKGTDVNADNQYGETPLHLAAESDSKDVAELLIAQGADLNAKNRTYKKRYGDKTPLHLAAESNNKDVAELLIAKGAYLNPESKYGTPLHLALKNNSKDVAKLLKSHGGKE